MRKTWLIGLTVTTLTWALGLQAADKKKLNDNESPFSGSPSISLKSLDTGNYENTGFALEHVAGAARVDAKGVPHKTRDYQHLFAVQADCMRKQAQEFAGALSASDQDLFNKMKAQRKVKISLYHYMDGTQTAGKTFKFENGFFSFYIYSQPKEEPYCNVLEAQQIRQQLNAWKRSGKFDKLVIHDNDSDGDAVQAVTDVPVGRKSEKLGQKPTLKDADKDVPEANEAVVTPIRPSKIVAGSLAGKKGEAKPKVESAADTLNPDDGDGEKED